MNLKRYLGARDRDARFASFDYCFNHFQAHRGPRLSALTSDAGMELSCLHLGFFLASWGMFRGSSRLLKRSARYYEPVVDTIASIDSGAWEIDAHAYSNDSIGHLIDVASRLRAALPGGASDTLVTKIMLGVFGCVPAFDLYFKRGFNVATFGRKSLLKISRFYEENSAAIEAHRVPTLDFATGEDTGFMYTRAKVIDMNFFVEGGYLTEIDEREA